MENVANNRIKYLDIIKTVSIFLVVFCHVPLLKYDSRIDNIAMLLCWSAVPCFFMCTGALYLNKEWKMEKYIKNMYNLFKYMYLENYLFDIF